MIAAIRLESWETRKSKFLKQLEASQLSSLLAS